MIGLEIGNSFSTWEGSLVGALVGLMIGPGEGYLVGLSLGLPLGYPLEYPNPGSELPGTLLGAPIGFWFGSEAVGCWCF